MQSRAEVTQSIEGRLFDVLVIGGGINGSVSALSLSAKGISTLLVDRGDFASATSQQSSSLAWGGIKYLESGEFSLVWQLCHSRNELMRLFPSQVKEIRFFTKLEKGFRKPRFFIFLGTLLYWIMGRFTMQPPRLLSTASIKGDEPMINTANCQGGVEYSDCYFVDTDTRFVFNLVKQAQKNGALTANYLEVTSLTKADDGLWRVELKDAAEPGRFYQVKAKSIVNAAGPYADQLNQLAGIQTAVKHLFSKGVHLIVPRITSAKRVLTFFADDGRMFFVIPMGERSCIGTTDTMVEKLPAVVSDEDRSFILSNINKRLNLKHPLTLPDVIAERCGVRPLAVEPRGNDAKANDWLSLSRKHVIEVDKQEKVVSIFGGKLTDCLNVGREVGQELAAMGILGDKHAVKFSYENQDQKHLFFEKALKQGVSKKRSERLWRRFQEDAFEILASYDKDPSLKEPIFPDYSISWGELVFIGAFEMVETLSDVLRRRTNIEQDFPIKDGKYRELLEAIAIRVFGRENAPEKVKAYLAAN